MTGTAGLVSGEGVALELERAGVGSRSVAAAIDLAVQYAVLVALLLGEAFTFDGLDLDAATALVLVQTLALLAGYPVVMEWLTRGRTLGKMAMGLRVVRDDGGPIGLRHAVVRGLAGLVIEKPGLLGPVGVAIGLCTMLFSTATKRVGDMMAGTFVVNERAGRPSGLSTLQLAVPPTLAGWAAALDLSGVDDALALSVREFLSRVQTLTPSAQHDLGEQFRHRLEAVTAPPPPPGLPTPWFLTTVVAERRRRAEQAVAPAYQLSQYQPAWNEPAPYRPLPYQPAPYQPGGPMAPPAGSSSSGPTASGFAPPG